MDSNHRSPTSFWRIVCYAPTDQTFSLFSQCWLHHLPAFPSIVLASCLLRQREPSFLKPFFYLIYGQTSRRARRLSFGCVIYDSFFHCLSLSLCRVLVGSAVEIRTANHPLPDGLRSSLPLAVRSHSSPASSVSLRRFVMFLA